MLITKHCSSFLTDDLTEDILDASKKCVDSYQETLFNALIYQTNVCTVSKLMNVLLEARNYKVCMQNILKQEVKGKGNVTYLDMVIERIADELKKLDNVITTKCDSTL